MIKQGNGRGNGVVAESGQHALLERPERVEELLLAGIGLRKGDSRKKPKKFRKAVKRGRRGRKTRTPTTASLARCRRRLLSMSGLEAAGVGMRFGSAEYVSTECEARTQH